MPYLYTIELSSMKSPLKLLKECVKRLLNEEVGDGTLRIFDFDDTLVKTGSRVYVTSKDGAKAALTPGEYAVYDKRPGDRFDYSDFEKLIEPREIKPMMKLFDFIYTHRGHKGVAILSARTSMKPIKKFLSSFGYEGVHITALNDANPKAKADWVSDRLSRGDVNVLEFFDDSYKNVAAIKALKQKHPDVKIRAYHVAHVPSKTKKS